MECRGELELLRRSSSGALGGNDITNNNGRHQYSETTWGAKRTLRGNTFCSMAKMKTKDRSCSLVYNDTENTISCLLWASFEHIQEHTKTRIIVTNMWLDRFQSGTLLKSSLRIDLSFKITSGCSTTKQQHLSLFPISTCSFLLKTTLLTFF